LTLKAANKSLAQLKGKEKSTPYNYRGYYRESRMEFKSQSLVFVPSKFALDVLAFNSNKMNSLLTTLLIPFSLIGLPLLTKVKR